MILLAIFLALEVAHLYKELKEDLSLVTSIYSSNYSMRHSGVFMISGTMLHENIDKAIKGIIERIKNIQSLNFNYGQVERAKNSIISDDLHMRMKLFKDKLNL